MKGTSVENYMDAIDQRQEEIIVERQVLRTQGEARLPPWQARRLVEYIERNLSNPITVSELSGLVNLDRSHFSRKFKTSFGAPPHNYVLRRRIQLASRLLIENDSPLSQIALLCGFADQPHFCKRFKKEMRITPSAWRQIYASCKEDRRRR